jgi:hypothetical protein
MPEGKNGTLTYQIAQRLQQISGQLLSLNQGTLYPALVRLEQRGWIESSWAKTESGWDAKFYAITKNWSARSFVPVGLLVYRIDFCKYLVAIPCFHFGLPRLWC